MGDGSVQLEAAAECRRNHVVQARRRDRGVGTVEGAGVCGETDVVVGPARDDERVEPGAGARGEIGVVERPGVIAAERRPALEEADTDVGAGGRQPPCREAPGESAACDEHLKHVVRLA